MKIKVVKPNSPHEVGEVLEVDSVPSYLANKVVVIDDAEVKLEVATPSKPAEPASKKK